VAVGLLLATVILASSCTSHDPDEGGIIGTGIVEPDILLRGTVSDSQFASLGVVEIKSSDGQRTTTSINPVSQFNGAEVAGSAPWVLRVSLSEDRAVYGIAFVEETRNINRFSDITLRQWFAQETLDLDDEFTSTGPFTGLPTAAEYAEVVSSVFSLIEPVLVSYGATADGVIREDYNVEELAVGVSDQGTNAFLQRNTVLIDNQTFQFLITDPATQTQSTTLSAVTLGDNLVDSFFNAPTQPESVRALGSAIDEIVLVWSPSIDDISVVGYEVNRDGVRIATTPYPVYIDSGLVFQDYSYEIIAIDTVGNASEPSTAVIASPLQLDDTTPPPAPTVLIELESNDSSIHLLWAQSSIEDVVSFNVLRGRDTQSLELRFKVTSTELVDTAVIPGVTFCYAVEAVDASGNSSELSDILCVVTGSSNSDGMGNTEPLVDWNIPNVELLNCTQTITGDTVLLGLTVVASGCYTVPETLLIGPGATLRLDAGVVLVFGTDAGLIVSSNATLTTNGTASEPVVLTGNVNVPGSWYGVEFQNSMSSGNLLPGTVVQYAGGGDSLAGISAILGRSRLRIEDTLIQFHEKRALHFSVNDTLIDEFRGNRITANESIGQIVFELIPSLAGNSDFSGNEDPEIEVPFNTYTNVNFTIPNLGVSLRWNGLTMVQDSIISVDGTFNAVGTAEQPIVMHGINTSTDPFWGGVALSGRGDKTFNHVQVLDSGDRESASSGAIEIMCSPESAATISIDNAEITESVTWGIFISGQGCDIQIGENVIYFNNSLGDLRLP